MSKPRLLAVLGVALAFAAPLAQIATLRVPWLRSSGLPMFATLAGALVCTTLAWRARRELTTRLAMVAVALLTGAMTYGFVVWQRLPVPAETSASERAVDVELLDESGAPFSLASRFANGPLLLVFYRGSW